MNADMVKPDKYDFIPRFSLSLYNIFKEVIITLDTLKDSSLDFVTAL